MINNRQGRDVERLTGRRADQSKRAVLWDDLSALSEKVALKLAGGPFGKAIGPYVTAASVDKDELDRLLPLSVAIQQVNQDIDSNVTFIENVQDQIRGELSELSDRVSGDFDALRPRVSGAEDTIDDLFADLSTALSLFYQTEGKLADAGIFTDPSTGEVKIQAFIQADQRLSTAETLIDAQAAEITNRVTFTEMNQALSALTLDPTQIPIVDELELRLQSAETEISGLNGTIINKANVTTVNGLDTRVTDAETEIDALQGEIQLKVSDSEFTPLQNRVSEAEVVLGALDVPNITQIVIDTSQQFDELDESKMQTLEDLLNNYRDREAVSEELAFVRRRIKSEVNEAGFALSQATESLAADIAGNRSLIESEQIARSNADSALASDITTLETRVGDAEAEITGEKIARSNADNSFASNLNSLSANFATASANIQENAAAIATVKGYQAATYTMRVDAGDAEGSLELVAADDPVNGPRSAFRMRADNILLDGTVLAPHLNVGELSAITADMGTVTAGVVQSADGKFVIDLNNKKISITV